MEYLGFRACRCGGARENVSSPALAAQQAVAADTLIEAPIVTGFRFEPFQFLLGSSVNPRAAEPQVVGRRVGARLVFKLDEV